MHCAGTAKALQLVVINGPRLKQDSSGGTDGMRAGCPTVDERPLSEPANCLLPTGELPGNVFGEKGDMGDMGESQIEPFSTGAFLPFGPGIKGMCASTEQTIDSDVSSTRWVSPRPPNSQCVSLSAAEYNPDCKAGLSFCQL